MRDGVRLLHVAGRQLNHLVRHRRVDADADLDDARPNYGLDYRGSLQTTGASFTFDASVTSTAFTMSVTPEGALFVVRVAGATATPEAVASLAYAVDPAGDVYVVAQASANATILAQADQTNGSGFFNGDDAIVLRSGDAHVAAQLSGMAQSVGYLIADDGIEHRLDWLVDESTGYPLVFNLHVRTDDGQDGTDESDDAGACRGRSRPRRCGV